MPLVFARTMRVHGIQVRPGDEVLPGMLTDQRLEQLINLRRVVEEGSGDNRLPLGVQVVEAPSEVVQRPSEATELPPEDSSPETPAEVAEGPDSDGLWPCHFAGCDRRLGSARGRTKHENAAHKEEDDG